MRKPVRNPRRQRSQPKTIPAPVGGLNGRDGLAKMPETDAFVMDNWLPGATTVDSRLGNSSYATGIGAAVESLETYTGGAASKMLAFAGGSIYNVSAPGAVGAALQSGRASNKISSCMFSNAGNQYLLGVSGADVMFAYDGATVTNMVITGLTGSATLLQHVFAFKGRVYLGQTGQLGFYYLAVGAIQGAASYFDLSQVAKRGGSLAGIASFSNDSGNGPSDYIVFMTTEGEYIVYGGTDPSTAATWALVSRYYFAPPIGRKGWFDFKSDLCIITEAGVVTFSEIRNAGEQKSEAMALSSKLGRALAALNIFSGTHGWCALVYPRGGWLVVNCPATGGTSGVYYQFVMNTDTNAWTRFVGWNGLSFTMYNKRMYYSTYDGRVFLADEGQKDDGVDVRLDCRQAYNYFDDGYGMGAADKQFHFATFVMQSDGAPPLSAAINVNFEDSAPDYIGSLAGGVGAVWDVAVWDVDAWSADASTQIFTASFGKLGYAASIWLRASLSGTTLKWFATRVVFEKASGITL